VDISVRGRGLEIAEDFKDLVMGKLATLERFSVEITSLDCEFDKEGHDHRSVECQLTCFGARGRVLRVEAHAGDKRNAFDEAYTKLTEAVRRASDRQRSMRRRQARLWTAHSHELPATVPSSPAEAPAISSAATNGQPADDVDVVLETGPLSVREKRHATRPMTVLNALDEMELVGHDFFFFVDSETDEASVLYRRRGFDYGLIRLDIEDQPVS